MELLIFTGTSFEHLIQYQWWQHTGRKKPVERKIKVNSTSGYKYKNVPTLQLKGQYFKSFGFPIDTKVNVILSDSQIVITPILEEQIEEA